MIKLNKRTVIACSKFNISNFVKVINLGNFSQKNFVGKNAVNESFTRVVDIGVYTD